MFIDSAVPSSWSLFQAIKSLLEKLNLVFFSFFHKALRFLNIDFFLQVTV